MQWRNTNNCTCHATHQVETCHAGQQACVNAATFILDGEGNIHCCPPGSSSIQAFHTNLNGRQVDSCTCSFQVSPDDDIPEAANSVVFTNTQVAGEDANVTHIGQEARHAGRRFSTT
ncbi:uncharacterized protein LOC112567561 [Pomacea canaliculata]|nr:uncharacterized protein LOC112567561 [Pomacea canaliculata]